MLPPIAAIRYAVAKEVPVERRLAAILTADAVGYSRLMEIDEEGTLARLKSLRRDLIDPKIAEHRGRIVKTTGDGMLVEFGSVLDALRCAIAFQRDLTARDEGAPADRRIRFRVGINVGDVIVDEADIHGDGVNVAARLEALAEPGGICISSWVRDQVGDRLGIAFDDVGEHHLKNIERPIRVYRIKSVAAQAAVLPKTQLPLNLALPEKPSLAVLPFQNMSNDPEQDYFTDGIVEEITTAIARLPWLFVVARNSSFFYKGKEVGLEQVGRELGVRYALKGSVRKSGSRVRITGQLIDAANGAHIWADRFDAELDEIFELQDQIASSVVGAIEPKLRVTEIARATRKPTERLDAYDFYLRALAQVHRSTLDASQEAIRLSLQALAIDPAYGPAAGLAAWCRAVPNWQGWLSPTGPEYEEGVRLARQAIEFGKEDPDALWMAGHTLAYLAADHSTAAAAIQRALALNSQLGKRMGRARLSPVLSRAG